MSAAADELGIAKSAVSRRISDLERRLGVALVDRTSRRFGLTASGTEYARRARLVLESLEELDASLAPSSAPVAVSLHASSALLAHVIAPALPAIGLANDEGAAVLHLSSGVADTAPAEWDIVVTESPSGSGSPGRTLLTTSLVICGAPRHFAIHSPPLEPKDLDGHPAIAMETASEWRLSSRNRPLRNISLVSQDLAAAAAAAVSGIGLVQLPDYVAADAIAEGRLVRILDHHQPPSLEVKAVAREGAGPEVHRIIDALAGAIGGTVRSDRDHRPRSEADRS